MGDSVIEHFCRICGALEAPCSCPYLRNVRVSNLSEYQKGYQDAATRYEDVLREVASILASISSDEGEAFMYSEHARIDKALGRLNAIIGDTNGNTPKHS